MGERRVFNDCARGEAQLYAMVAVATLGRRPVVRADDVTTSVPEVGVGHVT